MNWRLLFLFCVFFIWGSTWSVSLVHADAPPAYKSQHPLTWLHGLPTGEMPGWSTSWWVNFEAAGGNIWNAPLTMIDRRDGTTTYQYTADFEQAHASLELGHAISESFALGLELPYVYRSGGAMDHMIDSFHLLIGNRRFNRQYYPKNQNIFSVKTNNEEFYNEEMSDIGIANIHFKMKWWFLKWAGSNETVCPCGIALASQTKLPTLDSRSGGTTGEIDQSLLLHIGLPIFDESAIWLTGGYTFLGDNPAMKNWPRYDHSILYEMNADFSLIDGWGLILNARAESPFLDRSKLLYYDVSSDPEIIARNRSASGWNGLVYWRGSSSLGLRYRAGGGNQFQVLMVEDWGIGPYDTADNIYANGAPDINFVLQSKFVW